MKKLRVTVGYKLGHSYDFTYYHDNTMYCPLCGWRSVWVEEDLGDVEQGPNHICIACGGAFALPYADVREDKPYLPETQIIAQIKYYFPEA